MIVVSTVDMLDPLIETGALDEALEIAAGLVDGLETSEDVWSLASVRAAQARILALRGQAGGSLEWLESTTLGTGDAELAVRVLGSSAVARAALGQDERAAALLAELEATPDAREMELHLAFLVPAMVRIALATGDRALAERLVGGLEPRYPVVEHALVAANAALTEDCGDLQAAADAYADAAERWERFGVVPEQAFALLGQGRCLVALDRLDLAGTSLHRARQIFERLEAAPALAETDALLVVAASEPP